LQKRLPAARRSRPDQPSRAFSCYYVNYTTFHELWLHFEGLGWFLQIGYVFFQTNNEQTPNEYQTNTKFETVQTVHQQQKKSFVCPSELLPSPTQWTVGK